VGFQFGGGEFHIGDLYLGPITIVAINGTDEQDSLERSEIERR
jgi:hypothetical protein